MPLRLNLLFIFCAVAQLAAAQTADLVFDQPFTRCEKKWVVVPKKPTENRYAYGYVYVDQMAGYTFNLKGFLTINGDHFDIDTSATKTAMMKYRLAANWPKLALLPTARFAEMHINPEPEWVKGYYHAYTDTVQHNFRMGFNLNAAGDCETALTYLEPIYKKDPHYKGLEFELIFAYNALKQGDKALSILNPAIKSDPKNIMLYREKGFAYGVKGDKKNAIKAYHEGLDQCPDANNGQKAELTFNIGMSYKEMGDMDNSKTWMLKAKALAQPNTEVYRSLTALGY